MRPRDRGGVMLELAQIRPAHSITLSALSSTDCGTAIPSALAVFILTTSSNLVGYSTGSSAGFAPLRILSTYPAVRL